MQLNNEDTSYVDLKEIMDQINSGDNPTRKEFHNQIIKILSDHGIGIRTDDGHDPIVTISYPISVSDAIVVGLRYTKNDDSKTEDLFVFESGKPIHPYYKGSLEDIYPEYGGSHKLQR